MSNNSENEPRKHRSTEVNLKEYIEARIDDGERLSAEKWRSHLRVHASDLAALSLQAKEYERRLSELNQAHERAEKALNITVSREMFDQYVKDYEKSASLAIDTLRREVAVERESRRAFTGGIAVVAALPGLLALMLTILRLLGAL